MAVAVEAVSNRGGVVLQYQRGKKRLTLARKAMRVIVGRGSPNQGLALGTVVGNSRVKEEIVFETWYEGRYARYLSKANGV